MPHGPTLQQKRQQSSLARQVLIFTATVPNCSNLIHRQTGSDDPPYTYRTLKLFHAIHCSAQYHWIAWYNSTIFYHLYTSRAIWWTLESQQSSSSYSKGLSSGLQLKCVFRSTSKTLSKRLDCWKQNLQYFQVIRFQTVMACISSSFGISGLIGFWFLIVFIGFWVFQKVL